jgi:hypothetical protein
MLVDCLGRKLGGAGGSHSVGRAVDFTVSPRSTRRRVASERVGISGWFSAHFTMEARNTGAAQNPVMGSRPVAGRPRFFGLALIDIANIGVA